MPQPISWDVTKNRKYNPFKVQFYIVRSYLFKKMLTPFKGKAFFIALKWKCILYCRKSEKMEMNGSSSVPWGAPHAMWAVEELKMTKAVKTFQFHINSSGYILCKSIINNTRPWSSLSYSKTHSTGNSIQRFNQFLVQTFYIKM